MDRQAIFVKTTDGEEAVRQRTRLVQRNLRNILIMVDGQATVADLARRFGDENATRAALTELMAGGFIVASSGQDEAALTLPPDDVADVPVLTTQLDEPIAPAAVSETSPKTPPPVIEEIDLPAQEYESLPPQTRPAAQAVHVPQQPVPSGPDWVDRIKGLLARKEKGIAAPTKIKANRLEDDEEWRIDSADLEPISRGPTFFTWPVVVLFAVLGSAVLLGLTLVLYPYGRHLPEIEQKASAMLRDPVRIGDIGFSFLPRPHIALHNIKVGKDAHLTVASVRATPDFFSLLGEKKAFNYLELDTTSIQGAGLGRLAQVGAGGHAVEIRHVTLTNLNLTVGDVLLSGLHGEVMMNNQGAPEKILLRNADSTLKLEAKPKGEGYQVAASGSNWKATVKPRLVFQTIEMQGELSGTRLDLSKFEGRIFDGLVEGKASLEWTGSAVFTGNLELKHMNATQLLAALGTDLSAEGDLAARLRLDARADKLANLPDALRAEATFEMKRGALKGFDLGEAARRTGSAPTRGGETKFEQLTGTLQCSPQDCRLGNVRLSSGLFKASGNMGIAGNAQLSGGADVELRSSAATLRMPLIISGSTKDPLLTPGRGR